MLGRIARPSPTIVIAVVALVAALGGSAVAGVATSALSKKDKKQVKRIARNQATKQVDGQFPVDGSQIAGGAVTGGKLANGAVGTAKFSRSIPAARVTRTAAQTIPSGTTTTLRFDSERYDTAGLHGNGAANSRLRAPVDGVYEITANVSWEQSDEGTLRELFLVASDSGRIASVDSASTAVPFRQEVTTQARLDAGDYVEAQVFHASPTEIDVEKSDQFSPEFSMTWLAPG
jgi:hypothetical protein